MGQHHRYLSSLWIGFLLLVSNICGTAQSVKPPVDYFDQWGERFIPHHRVVSYFEAWKENITWLPYGKSWEGRPLQLAIITHKDNQANLETYRTDHLKRTGWLKGEISNLPAKAIVWISCSVHGNEPSATNASMDMLYQLMTRPDAQNWLKETIVILDPSLNPDGYDRYVQWYNGVANQVSNPNVDSREHQEPSPGGRVNHYYFDLNRDWAWMVQKETQQRMRMYRQWMPHVHSDLHEQGHNDPYYFAPAAEPYHPIISPWQRQAQDSIGKQHADYFDEEGWQYFTKEIFDLFYPSYGDTYPTFNGAIGMTYEQGGHSAAGHSILLDNGQLLTLLDRMEHHTTTALSTVEYASKNANKLEKEMVDFFRPLGSNPSYVIKYTAASSANINDLCQLLSKNGIDCKTGISRKGMKGFSFRKDQNDVVDCMENDVVIAGLQPGGKLAKVLLEREAVLSDSVTYDITAWSLLHAYGLDAYEVTTPLGGGVNYEVSANASSLRPNAYGYILPWNHYKHAQVLSNCLSNGLQVRIARKAFSQGELSYEPGTLVVLKSDQKASNWFETLAFQCQQHNLAVQAVESGWATKGADFGSDSYQLATAPKVGLLWHKGAYPNSFGSAWHYLDADLGIAMDVLDGDELPSKLHRWNTIILPEGQLDKATAKTLETWAQEGGRLIVLGNAAYNWSDSATIGPKMISVKDSLGAQIGMNQRRAMMTETPGGVVRARFHADSPLGYGIGSVYHSLKTSSLMFEKIDAAQSPLLIDGETLTSYGFFGSLLKKEMPQKSLIDFHSFGEGSILFLADDPLFRGFWQQGKLLMANAIFMQ